MDFLDFQILTDFKIVGDRYNNRFKKQNTLGTLCQFQSGDSRDLGFHRNSCNEK